MFNIYEIKNTVTGFRYIGCSGNLERRWKEHKRGLVQNKHHCIHLQRAWNKYGASVFEWKVLVECFSEELMFLEEKNLIEQEQSLYNVSKGGLGGNKVGDLSQEQYNAFLVNCSNSQKKRYERPGEREKANCFKGLTQEEREQRLKVWSDVKVGDKNGRYKNNQQVLQIDRITQEVVKVWDDIAEVGRSGYGYTNVLACLRGKKGHKTCKGYLWKWKNQN